MYICYCLLASIGIQIDAGKWDTIGALVISRVINQPIPSCRFASISLLVHFVI